MLDIWYLHHFLGGGCCCRSHQPEICPHSWLEIFRGSGNKSLEWDKRLARFPKIPQLGHAAVKRDLLTFCLSNLTNKTPEEASFHCSVATILHPSSGSQGTSQILKSGSLAPCLPHVHSHVPVLRCWEDPRGPRRFLRVPIRRASCNTDRH